MLRPDDDVSMYVNFGSGSVIAFNVLGLIVCMLSVIRTGSKANDRNAEHQEILLNLRCARGVCSPYIIISSS